MNNIITERESEVVASFIRHSILCVDNVTGGGFLNAKEMFISIVNPSNCPSNVSNFTFRSKINPHLVDNRPPDSIHYSKFPLRLPFTTLFLIEPSIRFFGTETPTSLISPPADTFDVTVNSLSDSQLALM